MVKKTLLSVMLVFFVAAAAQAGSGPDMQEGLWQITVEIEMPAMPMKMPPNTYTQCIKKDDLIPQNEQPNQECVQKDVSFNGNSVSWTVECNTPGGQMIGKGKATYNKDKMEGSMTTEGQGMKMISRFKGHRTGDCN